MLVKDVVKDESNMNKMDISKSYMGVPEHAEGNVEYKIQVTPMDQDRFEELASQMKFRLHEGMGQAIYVIGITDDGDPIGISEELLKKSEETLHKLARAINAHARKLREIEVTDGKKLAEFIIEIKKTAKEIPWNVNVVSLGNVDAGKSTLIGAIRMNERDDGRGKTRVTVFRHPHELETGRTSSVAKAFIGFDSSGKLVEWKNIAQEGFDQFIERCEKTITFYDLAGHEKYLKTTIFGLLASNPDYAMLVVAANQGLLSMTKEHLGLSIARDIPLFIVITKIDLAPKEVYKETLRNIKKILHLPGITRVPYVVKNKDDVIVAWRNLNSKRVVPIFPVSSVSWEGMEELIKFLSLLGPTHSTEYQEDQQPETMNEDDFELFIDDTFSVKGVGTVVSGIITQGEVHLNDIVLLGPLDNGQFLETRVKGIQYNRVNLESAWVGMSVTLALHNVKRDVIRKGMVIRSTKAPVAKRFDARIHVLYHSTTIRTGYTPVIHLRSIRQAARIIHIEGGIARTGDEKQATFEFLYRAERIKEGDEFVFREGRTRGTGKIIKIYKIKTEE